jgi:hypothetical protein
MTQNTNQYFIKNSYVANLAPLTLDENSGNTYWNKGRIEASYIYQFPV